ncbi:hypothetical protein Tco_1259137, partial [Tanacetum coccineum]
MIIIDPDDQPMWESAKTVAPTPNSVIVRPDVDDNFVINSTHLKMILENKFDGQLQADPHDHIREFLAICNMFKYGETQSEAVKLLIFPFSLCDKAKTYAFQLDLSIKSQNEHHQTSVAFANESDSNRDNSLLMEKLEALTIKMESQFQSLKEEMHEMHKNYNNRGGNQASKNDDTPMCERHEENQSEGNQNRNSHDLFSCQSHHDPNNSEKSLTDLNNEVKNDLEDFKRCVCSMRIVHSKLYEKDDQSKTDLEKTINKFLDGQGVANMYVKKNVNDMIIKIKQN